MQLRKAQISDILALLAVEQSIYGESGFNQYFFRQMIDLYPDLLWLVDGGEGELAGYVLGSFGQDRDKGWIMSLAVRKEYRGKGLARQLSETVLAELAKCGCRKVMLTVSEENQGAVALYHKLGFVDQGREADYFGPGLDRMVMCLAF